MCKTLGPLVDPLPIVEFLILEFPIVRVWKQRKALGKVRSKAAADYSTQLENWLSLNSRELISCRMLKLCRYSYWISVWAETEMCCIRRLYMELDTIDFEWILILLYMFFLLLEWVIYQGGILTNFRFLEKEVRKNEALKRCLFCFTSR